MRFKQTPISLWVSFLMPISAVAGTIELTPIQDNTLYESPPRTQEGNGELSNGAGAYLFAGRVLTGELRRALIAFDITGALPRGATITDVTLTLQMSKTIAGATPVGLHRLLADWGEGDSQAGGEEGAGAPAEPGDATWNHTFYPGSFWLAAGGDFTGPASSTQLVAGTGSYSWPSTPELVADVQAWLDSPSTNFGWLVLGSESAPPTAKRFNSRENGSGAPTLSITYQAPVPASSLWWLIAIAASLAAVGAWRLQRAIFLASHRMKLD